ncbi:hypothetical protein TCAP_04978 [Tolypocladium capitatum]|uniref:Uncharacterized protein n=1 Tax=Tolypocladium capitatum TaxID=45235 RepID=A0A2K3QC12_9HYPO|nr:hypothetical protein TCAP_04978 [Tolypocladium capitatum]
MAAVGGGLDSGFCRCMPSAAQQAAGAHTTGSRPPSRWSVDEGMMIRAMAVPVASPVPVRVNLATLPVCEPRIASPAPVLRYPSTHTAAVLRKPPRWQTASTESPCSGPPSPRTSRR